MRIFFTFILLLAAIMAKTQVIVDSTDMPVPGDTIHFRQTNNLNNINYQQTDTAFIWNFSALSSSAEVTDTFVTVGSTNLAYMIVFNNIFDPDNKATVAQSQIMQTIPFLPVTISEAFNFYKKSYSRFSILGMGTKINGVPMPFKFSNPDVWYNFPITYGSTDTSDSEFHANIPNMGYFGQTRHRINYVDGWGTLYLPADTFDVIRVKSKVTYYDTIYSDSIGFGIGINRNVTEYKWLTDGFHEPVLQINKQGQNNVTAKYYNHTPVDLSVNPIELYSLSDIFPNPVTNLLTIKLQNLNETITLTIRDITGREIFSNQYEPNTSKIELPVEQLQKGMYFISITSAKTKYCGKFVKS